MKTVVQFFEKFRCFAVVRTRELLRPSGPFTRAALRRNAGRHRSAAHARSSVVLGMCVAYKLRRRPLWPIQRVYTCVACTSASCVQEVRRSAVPKLGRWLRVRNCQGAKETAARQAVAGHATFVSGAVLSCFCTRCVRYKCPF